MLGCVQRPPVSTCQLFNMLEITCKHATVFFKIKNKNLPSYENVQPPHVYKYYSIHYINMYGYH